jgi:N-sulfoglucosamine sulfohydrolase
MRRSLLALLSFAAVAHPAERPNVVLLIADDLGAEDAGFTGNKAIRTPNLDRLAKDGLRFDRAFLTCSSCSPSRCSMLTGRYPHSHGAMRLHEPLPADQVTFTQKLRDAGYWTALAGKTHIGPPALKSFDLVKQGGGASGCENWIPTLRARPKDKPFFLWLAAFDPHRPYEPRTIPSPHDPATVVVPPYLPDVPEVRADLAMYYDEATRFDSFVGAVLQELKAQGLERDTLVLFLSDNGRPFPRCKTTVYDSGIRTPLVAHWPGRIKPGGVCPTLASSIDLAPTILALAGVEAPPAFQGVSLVPILDDPSKKVRDYVHAEHNWHDFDDHGRGVRNLRYKYIRNHYTDVPGTPPADAVRSPSFQAMRKLRDEKKLTPAQMNPFVVPRPEEELYACDADPHELTNLVNDPAHAAALKELRAEYDRWVKATDDKVPARRTPDAYDRETGEAKAKKK